MRPFETIAHVGPDGTLTVRAPADLAGRDVRVRLEEAPAADGERPRTSGGGAASGWSASPPSGPIPPAIPTMTPEEWRRFIRSTAGSMPDLPDIERPGPDSYDRRDWDA